MKEIPTINIKMETREVKTKVSKARFTILKTPYMIVCDKNGRRKIWTNNKWKIFLYYLYKITSFKWILKEYNKQSRNI